MVSGILEQPHMIARPHMFFFCSRRVRRMLLPATSVRRPGISAAAGRRWALRLRYRSQNPSIKIHRPFHDAY